MDLGKLFEKLSDEEIQEASLVINKKVQEFVSNGELEKYFPEQEIVYFNTMGFNVDISTIPKELKEDFEKLNNNEQSDFPKIAYSVELNASQPDPEDLENYVPFTVYIDTNKELDISDELEDKYLLQFKEVVLFIMGMIIENLYKKLEEQKGR